MSLRLPWSSILALLKSLPAIRFALMLGGGMVATVLVGIPLAVIADHAPWPAEAVVAVARIDALKFIALGALAIIAVVMVALAFGKAGKLRINGPGGIGGEIDFDDDEETRP